MRRRIGVVDRPGGQFDLQRLGQIRLIPGQILARDWAADAVEIGRQLAADVAAVKIVQTVEGEMPERRGERLLRHRGAGGRRLSVHQERIGEARRRRELG